MRTALSCLLALGSLAFMGCQSSHVPAAPGFYVPMAVIRGSDVPADHVLPTGSLAEAYIPRGERVAFGPPLAEGSAYTVYTYDAQAIGTPEGYGYRYRYVVRQGFTLP